MCGEGAVAGGVVVGGRGEKRRIPGLIVVGATSGSVETRAGFKLYGRVSTYQDIV